MLGFEVFVGAERVSGDSKDNCIMGGKFCDLIAKILPFSRATRGIILWVKVKDNFFPP
jgi:hypothetical protein